MTIYEFQNIVKPTKRGIFHSEILAWKNPWSRQREYHTVETEDAHFKTETCR